MASFFTKVTLVLVLVLFMLIAVMPLISPVFPHHILAYHVQGNVSLVDVDYRLSGRLSDSLTSTDSSDSLSWSPDGRLLSFISVETRGENPNSEIYIYSWADGQIRDVSNSPTTSEGWPAWSPDGQKLAFVAGYASTNGIVSEIRVIDLGTGQSIPYLAQMTGHDFLPMWSPDGKWLGFISARNGSGAMYIADTSNGAVQLLVKNPTSGQSPVWSPDSKYVAFTRGEYPPERPFGSDEIYIINVESKEEFNLTQNPNEDNSPRWSPDSSQILFISDRTGSSEYYLLNVATRLVRHIDLPTSKPLSAVFPPIWSSDGRWLAFLLSDNLDTNIYGYDFATNQLYRLTRGYHYGFYYPVWQP